MRLTDLQPIKLEGTLERGVVRFLCPCGGGHSVRVHVWRESYGESEGVRYWQASGAWPDSLTLDPSIDAKRRTRLPSGEWVDDGSCWHGHVRNGAVT